MKHKSDSSMQRLTETEALTFLAMKHGWVLDPVTTRLRNGASVNIDGADLKARILCEVYSHMGRLKGGQPGKIAKDILKLVAVERTLGRKHRKLICFTDEAAAACLRGKSWLAEVAMDLGVEVVVVTLGKKSVARLRAAQRRQVMVNQ